MRRSLEASIKTDESEIAKAKANIDRLEKTRANLRNDAWEKSRQNAQDKLNDAGFSLEGHKKALAELDH